jgi:hypothetical protein
MLTCEMATRKNSGQRLTLPGGIMGWGVVAVALLLALAALIFQIVTDIVPVILLTIAAIVAVVNLLPKRDLGI